MIWICYLKPGYLDSKGKDKFYVLFIDRGTSVKELFTVYLPLFFFFNHIYFFKEIPRRLYNFNNPCDQYSTYGEATCLIFTCNMRQKQLWKSDIWRKDASQWPAFDCMLLSCHVRVPEWIHNLLAKWLSVRLRTKW